MLHRQPSGDRCLCRNLQSPSGPIRPRLVTGKQSPALLVLPLDGGDQGRGCIFHPVMFSPRQTLQGVVSFGENSATPPDQAECGRTRADKEIAIYSR